MRWTELRQDELPPRQEPTDTRIQFDGRNESAQTRSLQQVYSTNSASRERHYNDEHQRKDAQQRHEEPGNDVCNYCATREARQHTNRVEVFLGSNQQNSTVDIVTQESGGEGGFCPSTLRNSQQ